MKVIEDRNNLVGTDSEHYLALIVMDEDNRLTVVKLEGNFPSLLLRNAEGEACFQKNFQAYMRLKEGSRRRHTPSSPRS